MMPDFLKLYATICAYGMIFAVTIILYILRIVFALLPSHAYLQPDEFFQFTEPVADRVFHTKTYLPWEFTREQPIRSMFFPVVVAGIPFTLIKKFIPDPSAWTLLVTPRLVMTLLSFVIDACFYKILRLNDLIFPDTIFPLFALSSSWVALTFFTRTFSNTIETVIFSIFLLVSTLFLKNANAKLTKDKLLLLDILGILLSVGFFNRPTFIAFAVVPMIRVLVSCKDLYLSASFQVFRSFCSTSFLLVVFDTNFYTDLFVDFWNIASNDVVSNIVITPLNFIQYNSQSGNLEKHGLHPRYLHLFNLFIIGSVLVIPLYLDAIRVVYNKIRRRSNPLASDKTGLLLTIFTPLFLLSIFPHQEPRFLLPLILPICLSFQSKVTLKGLVVHQEISGGAYLTNKRYLFPWIVINGLLFYFYAFVHQSGVTQSLFHLHNEVHDKTFEGNNTSIIFVNMYLPPQHLLHIPKYNPVKVHDLSVEPFPAAYDNLYDILGNDLKDRNNILMVSPSCMTEKLTSLVTQVSSGELKMNLVKGLFPHFSGETFNESWKMLLTGSDWRDVFCLNIWRISR